MDRPIFGGLSFPTPGPTEKRQLYLQEKLDRSRPPTPNDRLDRKLSGESSPTKVSPRQFETEILEERVATEHVSILQIDISNFRAFVKDCPPSSFER